MRVKNPRLITWPAWLSLAVFVLSGFVHPCFHEGLHHLHAAIRHSGENPQARWQGDSGNCSYPLDHADLHCPFCSGLLAGEEPPRQALPHFDRQTPDTFPENRELAGTAPPRTRHLRGPPECAGTV